MSDDRESVKTQQLHVGAILEQLRVEVRARRLAQGHAEPSSLERELQRALDEIELYRVVSGHWPLLGKTLPQRAIVLVNKLVRRYLRWYINPIVEQQNAYNDAVARTLRLLAEAYAELGEQLADRRPPTTDHRQGDDGQRTTDDTQHATRNTQHTALMSLVRERAAAEPPARFPDLDLRAMEPRLRLREQVSVHWPLLGKTPLQKAVALVNKLTRRYLRWYINPIVDQQNATNAAFTVALLQLIALDATRRAEVAALRAHRE